jgi:hypothetical protein
MNYQNVSRKFYRGTLSGLLAAGLAIMLTTAAPRAAAHDLDQHEQIAAQQTLHHEEAAAEHQHWAEETAASQHYAHTESFVAHYHSFDSTESNAEHLTAHATAHEGFDSDHGSFEIHAA